MTEEKKSKGDILRELIIAAIEPGTCVAYKLDEKNYTKSTIILSTPRNIKNILEKCFDNADDFVMVATEDDYRIFMEDNLN